MTRFHALLLSIAMVGTGSSIAAPAAQPVAPWAQVNGYWAGMTKAQAKVVGYSDCHFGKSGGEKSDSIYCAIPADKLTFAGMQAVKGTLEFGPKNKEKVLTVEFDLPVRREQAIELLTPVYGKPSGWQGSVSHVVWFRSTPEYMSLYGRLSKASLSLKFDADLPARIKKAEKDEAAKKATLKDF